MQEKPGLVVGVSNLHIYAAMRGHRYNLSLGSPAIETPHLCSRIVVDNELALRVPDREHWA